MVADKGSVGGSEEPLGVAKETKVAKWPMGDVEEPLKVAKEPREDIEAPVVAKALSKEFLDVEELVEFARDGGTSI